MVPDIYVPQPTSVETRYRCDKCDNTYVTEVGLEDHKKAAHSKAAERAKKEAIEDTKKVAEQASNAEEKEAAKETLQKAGVKI